MYNIVKTSIEAKHLLPKCQHPNCNCNIAQFKVTKTHPEDMVEITKIYKLNNFEVGTLIVCTIYALTNIENNKINRFMRDNFTKQQREEIINNIKNYDTKIDDGFHLSAAEAFNEYLPKLFETIVIQFIINFNAGTIENIKII
jgi:hypothetical protein